MELNWLLRASQRAVRRYLSLASTLEVQIDISRIYNSNRWAAVQEKRPPGVRRLRLGLLLDRREPARQHRLRRPNLLHPDARGTAAPRLQPLLARQHCRIRKIQNPVGKRAEYRNTPRKSIRNAAPKRDSEFYKNIIQLLCAGAKEMPVIKSVLMGDQHGHTPTLEHYVASRIDGDVCWFGEDQRFSL
jgi:hypothetical protein